MDPEEAFKCNVVLKRRRESPTLPRISIELPVLSLILAPHKVNFLIRQKGVPQTGFRLRTPFVFSAIAL